MTKFVCTNVHALIPCQACQGYSSGAPLNHIFSHVLDMTQGQVFDIYLGSGDMAAIVEFTLVGRNVLRGSSQLPELHRVG